MAAELPDNKKKRKGQAASAIVEAERIVSNQVPLDRHDEILEYLKLFGYKPDRTIVQVHVEHQWNISLATQYRHEPAFAETR